MGDLTSKQLNFCRLVAAGDRSNVDCYRESYDAGGTAKTAREAASRLLKKANVRATIVKFQDRREEAIRNRAISNADMVLELLRGAVAGEIELSSQRLRAAEVLGNFCGLRNTLPDTAEKIETSSAIREELQRRLAALGLSYDRDQENNESGDTRGVTIENASITN